MLFRVGVIAAAAVGAPIFGPGQPAYIRPAAHGTGSGLSYANAGSLADLPTFVQYSDAGTTIYIIADDGAYTINSSLNTLLCRNTFATAANPVTIKGVNSSLVATKAVFNGTRDSSPTVMFTGGTTNGSSTITVANTTGLVVGMTVQATNLAYPAVIQSIVANTSITVNQNASSTNGAMVCVASPLLYRTSFETSGYDLFDLRSGASYLNFANFTINDMGSVFLPQASLTGLTFTDIDCDNVFAFFQSEADTFGVANTIDQFVHTTLTFTRCNGAGFSGGFIRTWHNPKEILVDDCDADAERQIDIAFNSCFHVGGTSRTSTDPTYLAINSGGGPTFLNCTGKNAWYHSTSSNYPSSIYWNSDGFSDERTISGALYRDCTANDNTDGGFDLKSTSVVIDGCSATGNKFNFKLWGTGTLTDCTSINPVKIGGSGSLGHLSYFGSTNIDFTLTNFTATGGVGNAAAFLNMESSATGTNVLHVNTHTISLQSGTTIIDTPTAPGTIKAYFSPALPAVNAETDTLLAAMITGGNPLEYGLALIADTLMTALKADNIPSISDLMYFAPTTEVEDQSLYNWKVPASYKLTASGGPTYNTRAGWSGDGVDAYYDSGLAANLATFFTQNDSSMSWAVWDNVQRAVDVGAASSSMARGIGRNTSDNMGGSLASSSQKTMANTTGQAVFCISKTDSTHYTFYVNGVPTAVAATNSSALTAFNFTILRISTSYAPTGMRVGYFRIGSKMTDAKALAEYTAVRTAARAVDASLIA